MSCSIVDEPGAAAHQGADSRAFPSTGQSTDCGASSGATANNGDRPM